MEETRKFKLILTMAQQQVGQEMTPQVRDAVLGNAHLHISGRTKLPKTVTPFMDVDTIDIENLRRGQFYARVGSAPAFTFKIPTHLLGTAGSMPDEEWERVKAAQLKRYYRPVASPTPSPNGPDPDPPQPSPDPFNVDRV